MGANELYSYDDWRIASGGLLTCALAYRHRSGPGSR
jgi:hypothetical protein